MFDMYTQSLLVLDLECIRKIVEHGLDLAVLWGFEDLLAFRATCRRFNDIASTFDFDVEARLRNGMRIWGLRDRAADSLVTFVREHADTTYFRCSSQSAQYFAHGGRTLPLYCFEILTIPPHTVDDSNLHHILDKLTLTPEQIIVYFNSKKQRLVIGRKKRSI